MPTFHTNTAKIVLSLATIALAASACSSSDDGEAPPPPTLGSVNVTSHEYFTDVFGYSVVGWFDESRTEAPECTSRREGDCTITTCTPPAGDAGVSQLESAGTLTLSGGLLPAAGINLEPGEDKSYFYSGGSKIWEPGQRITIKNTAAQIPTFELSVAAPSNLTLEAPAVPPRNETMIIPRDKPLELRWSVVPEKKSVSLFSGIEASLGTPAIYATCGSGPSSTTATFPASVLGSFPKGDALFAVSSENDATTIVAGKTVAVHAVAYAKGTSGTSVSRNVTLE